jgi:hypothetical protein
MANPNPKPHWKKGQSGNPNGRPPKGYSITDTIRSMMDKNPAIKESLAEKILEKALIGDKDAIKLIWNYIDGMPVQKVQSENVGESEGVKMLRELIAHDEHKLKDKRDRKNLQGK